MIASRLWAPIVSSTTRDTRHRELLPATMMRSYELKQYLERNYLSYVLMNTKHSICNRASYERNPPAIHASASLRERSSLKFIGAAPALDVHLTAEVHAPHILPKRFTRFSMLGPARETRLCLSVQAFTAHRERYCNR